MNRNFYPHKVLNFCPRCGSHDFSVINPKAKKCGQCALIFYTNPAAAVIAIIKDSEGKFLFTRRTHDPGKGMLDLPGGFIDNMETAESAVAREIREELNLEVMSLEYWTTFPNEYLYSGLVYFTLDMAFFCRIKTLKTIKVADDVTGFEFLKPDKSLCSKIGLLSIKCLIEKYVQDFPQ